MPEAAWAPAHTSDQIDSNNIIDNYIDNNINNNDTNINAFRLMLNAGQFLTLQSSLYSCGYAYDFLVPGTCL